MHFLQGNEDTGWEFSQVSEEKRRQRKVVLIFWLEDKQHQDFLGHEEEGQNSQILNIHQDSPLCQNPSDFSKEEIIVSPILKVRNQWYRGKN